MARVFAYILWIYMALLTQLPATLTFWQNAAVEIVSFLPQPPSITTKNGVILQDIWPKHHVHCARWGIYYGAKTLHTHTQATCMRVPISKVFGGGSDGVLMSNFLAYPPVATFRILADNGWRLSLYRSEGNTFSNPSCWAGGFFSQIRFNSG